MPFATPGGTNTGGDAENCYEVWVEPNKDEVYMNDIRCDDSSRRYVCQFPGSLLTNQHEVFFHF